MAIEDACQLVLELKDEAKAAERAGDARVNPEPALGRYALVSTRGRVHA